MQDTASSPAAKSKRPAKEIKPAKDGPLLQQLLTLTDLTLRNSRDTETQREALELKELLEQWSRQKTPTLAKAA